MNTTTPLTISNDAPVNPASDFHFLRQEGIRHIQQLAGTTWTDHNVHDPGITILDQLCYAITDLSYRLDHDITDLLATETGDPYKSLFSPANILSVNPVTLTDLRKALIDVEGVRNAWIEKQTQSQPALYYYPDDKTLNLFESGEKQMEQLSLQGMYRVLIEPELSSASTTLLADVVSRLHAGRNLCEDFDEIKILDTALVTVSGMVEVGQTADIDMLAAGVLFRIAQFISPQLQFYTLADMLQKGKSGDEIFEGPALVHGFIDEDELNTYTRKTALHTSDIIREIMDEPGVSYVSNISISYNSALSAENWFLAVEEGKTPVLDYDHDTTLLSAAPLPAAGKASVVQSDRPPTTDQTLVFRKNGVKLRIDRDRVRDLFKALKTDPHRQSLKAEDKDIVPRAGMYRRLHTYYSIQNHFPQLYGIGEAGLPASASPARKAQAKQLKAYLLLFEQILANYCAQAAGLKQLFSFSPANEHTYFHQSIINIVPGAEELFTCCQAGAGQQLAGITESGEEALVRKNRLLDHLLARFGESVTNSTMHLQSYYANHAGKRWLPDNQQSNGETAGLEDMVNGKLRFLANYPHISNERGQAFNYKKESWKTDNVSGLEKRIAAKLGISNCTRRCLASGNNTEEGFHLLEHILLRPVQKDVDVLTPYRIPHDITAIRKAGDRLVECDSAKHGLQSGDRVIISRSNFYDGIYQVISVLPDSFQIQANYHEVPADTAGKEPEEAKQAQWQRDIQGINASVLTFTKPVISFAGKENDSRTTVCTSPAHGLVAGDTIEISGTKNYNGTYTISKVASGPVAADLFEIHKPFAGQETAGRFVKAGIHPDPYSLQFTCMFPAWIGRFSDDNFRVFVENTIREETPVHLTVYVRWLGQPEMDQFEKFFRLFLSKLKS
ncbi:MAG: hypothetical protein INR73_06595 [Williamsia sp.]|nr:hypothetical protein [Williamsia sp.]